MCVCAFSFPSPDSIKKLFTYIFRVNLSTLAYFMHNAIINFTLAYQLNPCNFLFPCIYLLFYANIRDQAHARAHHRARTQLNCAVRSLCVCVNVCVSGFGRFLTLLSSVCYLCCFIVKNSVHKTPFGCKQRKHRIEVNGRDNMHTPKKHTNHFYFLSACVLSVFICCGWLFPVVNPIVIYTELVSSSLTAH